VSLASPVVIFVKPKASGNIGALARVLSNFGVSELRLVGNPNTDAQEDAFKKLDWALSCKGQFILEKARWFPTLTEALIGIQIPLGTSGRSQGFERGYDRPLRDPTAAYQELAKRLGKSEDLRWALVMGTEDDGLSSEEAALCQELIRIPTSDLNPSMNIAMACGVLLYHWRMIQLGVIPMEAPVPSTTAEAVTPFYDPSTLDSPKSLRSGRNRYADQSEKEKWIDYLFTILDQTQMFKYPDREALKARIRRWLQNGEIPLGELLFAFEVLYQIKSWGTGQFDKRDFLNDS
jgi:TrmH family RNA methyltransferase